MLCNVPGSERHLVLTSAFLRRILMMRPDCDALKATIRMGDELEGVAVFMREYAAHDD